MPRFVSRLRNDRAGATRVEYALIAAAIAVSTAAAVGLAIGRLQTLFN